MIKWYSLLLLLCWWSHFCHSQTCLGEFELCSKGDCVMCSNNCGVCEEGQYLCPISKQCVNSAADYVNCPGIKGTHLDWTLSVEHRVAFLNANLSINEKYPQLTNDAPQIERLGIPSYQWLNDDEHGVRNSHSTMFPDGCGLGATWSKHDLHSVGNIVGNEARSLHNSLVHSGNRGHGQNGATVTLYAPNMNLVRDPRWGRSQEVYSEDPRLTGHLTYEFVTGLQFGGEQENKYLLTAACCKHYAAYDIENVPQLRFTFNAIVDAVNWAETYSPAFRECVVRAQGQHVMCAYNSINGIPSCGNNYTLNKVLRDDWNFKGFVVSDYDAMAQIYTAHGYAQNYEEAVSIAIKAGCDQEGTDSPLLAIDQIPNAIKDGLLTESDVSTAIGRLWRVRIKLGLFDPPTMVNYNKLENDSSVEGAQHLNASRRIAAHSMTLYKNDNNALPVDRSEVNGIAVIGPQSIDPRLLLGNYATYPDKGVITILQGLREGLGENTTAQCTYLENTDYDQPGRSGTTVYSAQECCSLCFEDDACNYWTYYWRTCYLKQTGDGKKTSNGRISGQCTNNPITSKIRNANGCETIRCLSTAGFVDALDLINKMKEAQQLSAILVVLGLDQTFESEQHDRTTIELPGQQNTLVTAIYNNMTKNDDNIALICLLIHGGTLALGSAVTECDAILDGWYPGSQGGYGIADIMYGAVSVAGRAGVTSYLSTAELPKQNGDMNEYNGDGVTYRYYKKRPLWPFGYGLSYTTFSYSNLRLNVTKSTNNNYEYEVDDGCEVIGVTVRVSNDGARDGDEVIQVYVKQPVATVQAPNVRLGDFERVSIKSGESVDVQLVLTARYHSVVYNASSASWYEPDIQIEKGVFEIYVGGGQPDYFKGVVNTNVMVNKQTDFSKCDIQY